jgi:hypothetical protein
MKELNDFKNIVNFFRGKRGRVASVSCDYRELAASDCSFRINIRWYTQKELLKMIPIIQQETLFKDDKTGVKKTKRRKKNDDR